MTEDGRYPNTELIKASREITKIATIIKKGYKLRFWFDMLNVGKVLVLPPKRN